MAPPARFASMPALRAACVALAAAALACDATPSAPPTPSPQGPPARSSVERAVPTLPHARDAGTGTKPRPRLALDPRVRRSMKVPPRLTPSMGLAFGKGRLGVLEPQALVIRGGARFGEEVRLVVDRPRALVTIADGSLLVADREATLRVMPHQKEAHRYPRLPLLSESFVFGDRASPDRLWVLPAHGGTLFGYGIGAGETSLLPIAAWVELAGFDRRAFGSLRDGGFLYTTATGLRRLYGTATPRPIAGAVEAPWRILPGSRPDTTWVLGADGAVTLSLIVGDRLVRQQALHLEASPYDAVADGELLAALELVQPSDAPWSWILEVFDVHGRRRMRDVLPAEERFEEDTWLAALVGDRGLSLSASPPRVAVGGPTALVVWDAHKGERIYAHP